MVICAAPVIIPGKTVVRTLDPQWCAVNACKSNVVIKRLPSASLDTSGNAQALVLSLLSQPFAISTLPYIHAVGLRNVVLLQSATGWCVGRVECGYVGHPHPVACLAAALVLP